jgi:hypothetical protein
MKLHNVSMRSHFQTVSAGEKWAAEWKMSAHRHEKKNTSHVNMGRNGKKNWLVAGARRAATRSATAPVFSSGLGEGLIDSAKIPNEIRNRY